MQVRGRRALFRGQSDRLTPVELTEKLNTRIVAERSDRTVHTR
jgi:hypothetical protein